MAARFRSVCHYVWYPTGSKRTHDWHWSNHVPRKSDTYFSFWLLPQTAVGAHCLFQSFGLITSDSEQNWSSLSPFQIQSPFWKSVNDICWVRVAFPKFWHCEGDLKDVCFRLHSERITQMTGVCSFQLQYSPTEERKTCPFTYYNNTFCVSRYF